MILRYIETCNEDFVSENFAFEVVAVPEPTSNKWLFLVIDSTKYWLKGLLHTAIFSKYTELFEKCV